MATIGLITEGITDQIIISNILFGYFNDPNLSIRELQPQIDETDKNLQTTPGNWLQVLNYCESDSFGGAFQFVDYIIIQIDTDTCEEKGFDVQKRDSSGKVLSVTQLIECVCDRLKDKIGKDLYSQLKERIIFAITVDSMECWLLPLHATKKNIKAKQQGCLNALNRSIRSKFQFTIGKKDPEYYRILSEDFSNQKILKSTYIYNPSLQIFVDYLEKVFNKWGL